MDELEEFRHTYITECLELLSDMEERLLNLEEGSTDLESLHAIFRCAHSIKGGAGIFNLTGIGGFTHILETLLDKMRDGGILADRAIIDLLLKCQDRLCQMVEAAREGLDSPTAFYADLKDALSAYVTEGGLAQTLTASNSCAPVSHTEATIYHIDFRPHETLLAHGHEPISLLRELSTLGKAVIQCDTSRIPAIDGFDPTICYLSWQIELETDKPESAIRDVFEFVEDECKLTIKKLEQNDVNQIIANQNNKPAATGIVKTDHAAISPSPIQPQQNTTSIRVDISKVDALINMVGEVVITQAMLMAQSKSLPPQHYLGLINGIEVLSQHIRELQEAVMAIRMQPVKSVFSRMPRMVRDLSAKLGKEVRLSLHGEQTEVDKTIIEQLSDPLTHLIRNAIDHGIESPQEREASGKPREGQVILSAEHGGGRIIIEIRDDGRGINRKRVLEKARERGLVETDAILTDNDIDNLIFAPGFSTAETVSDVSGRGVGMDVVKKNIEAIGGAVGVTSYQGKGSIFTITLPLTLAILDGMIVRIGHENYIIPINHILESMRPASTDVYPVVSGSDVIRVRGEFIPLIYLHRLFAIPHAINQADKGIVVLVENGLRQVGLVVDELVGQQQVVIKSLEENADRLEGISGATILGDGKVSLILDVNGLCKMATRQQPILTDMQAA